jgi:hypothetical protein
VDRTGLDPTNGIFLHDDMTKRSSADGCYNDFAVVIRAGTPEVSAFTTGDTRLESSVWRPGGCYFGRTGACDTPGETDRRSERHGCDQSEDDLVFLQGAMRFYRAQISDREGRCETRFTVEARAESPGAVRKGAWLGVGGRLWK